MKHKEVAYNIPCPTCGAQRGERCELHSGAERSEPHRGRKDQADDLEAPGEQTRKTA